MASRESSLIFSLERGLGIVLWVRQEKKALTSRGWGLLRGRKSEVLGCFVLFVVFNQQVVFFQNFLLSKNYIAFTNVLQGEKCNWIESNSFLLRFPLTILLIQSMFSCVNNILA